MLSEHSIHTEREGFYNITAAIREAVTKSGVANGLCVVFCPHTTAGITVNENADPDVVRDMLLGLSTAYPEDNRFRHLEGNTTAHLKAGALGCSQTLIIRDGGLLRGQWQGIYFCEFDGPRSRRYYVKIQGDRQ